MFDNHGYKNIVTYPTGVTYKDHQKWKIAENQTFSAIFILSESSEIGKIYKNPDLSLVPAMR